ncbi:hypothetical protein BC835DRAFT_1417997 [Cytidiella melzeri]|nr:hypothetical protein BC835DRAFT_1417997 [Cytidiella melzeri]
MNDEIERETRWRQREELRLARLTEKHGDGFKQFQPENGKFSTAAASSTSTSSSPTTPLHASPSAHAITSGYYTVPLTPDYCTPQASASHTFASPFAPLTPVTSTSYPSPWTSGTLPIPGLPSARQTFDSPPMPFNPVTPASSPFASFTPVTPSALFAPSHVPTLHYSTPPLTPAASSSRSIEHSASPTYTSQLFVWRL